MANETELIRLQDIANARLEILLGKMQRINELCKTEEIELYRGNESFTAVCNVLKCKTMSVIEKITEYVSYFIIQPTLSTFSVNFIVT